MMSSPTFSVLLTITLSVVNADGSDLDNNINNVTVHQADLGDMLFQAGLLRIIQPRNISSAMEFLGTF